MDRRQSRAFAIGATAVATLAFVGLTVDSHRKFDGLTNAQNLTPSVIAGKDVWHRNNCINCHTLFGEGAYYAPDLTKIAQHRSEAYLVAYMRDPSRFYDEQRHRRLMPRQNLSDNEITDLVAFLDWVSKVDNQGWPPRPILVTGATLPGTDLSVAQSEQAQAGGTLPPGARPLPARADPIALGQSLFRSASPACAACHSVSPGVNMAGPSLGGIASTAAQRIADPAYKGEAKDAAGYIRESILHPNTHLVPGAMYSANGQSFMPMTYAQSLQPEQVDELVAYLGSLK